MTVWRHLVRDPWAVAGLVVVALFALGALTAPLITGITGQDPTTYHLETLDDTGAPRGPGGGVSAVHWFGVEPLTGRDLFAIVLFGSRISLVVGVAATAVSVALGVLVGLVAGYFGGWVDRLVSRVIDVLLGFPALIFMIALTAVVAASFPRPVLIVLVIGFFGWPAVARVVRGQTLALRRRTFVVATEAMGAPATWVLRQHVLPNIGATVVVYGTILVPAAIGTEAALSFLGVGVPPPTPSWGRSIGDAVTWFAVDPAYVVFPGGALFLLTLAFNAFGDGLRDALDPRVNRRRAPEAVAPTTETSGTRT